ncbi:exonuclease domain-containing protein [Bacillus daqingensis]
MLDRWRRSLGALAGGAVYDHKGGSSAGAAAYARQLERDRRDHKELTIPLQELPVTVVDLETTGFSPAKGDKILSIGAVRVEKGQRTSFYSPIFTENPPEPVLKLTGLTKQELIDAPPAAEVVKDFLSFSAESTLVAHHSAHEKAFLNHTLWKLYRMKLSRRIVDTRFAVLHIHELEHAVTLEEFCRYFDVVPEGRHHALLDAKAAADIWTEACSSCMQNGIYTLADMYKEAAAKT